MNYGAMEALLGMKYRLPVILTALLGTLGGQAARSDELHLRDGVVVQGEVTREGDEYIVSRSGGAMIRIPVSEVVRHERKQTLRQRYDNLREVYGADSFKDQMELGNWCRINNLPEEARRHFLRAVELDPNDAAARRAAGYVRHENSWVTREEKLALEGKSWYKGRLISAAEAERLRGRDEVARLREEGYAEAWAILRAVAKNPSVGAIEQAQAQLREMGEYAMRALIRGARDANRFTRKTAIPLLGAQTSADTLDTLVECLRFEEYDDLLRDTVQQLVLREDRADVQRRMLDLLLRSPARNTRQRTWLVLRGIGDKAVIPLLIEAAEFTPVPGGAAVVDDKKATHGWITSTSRKPRQKPYYPACEALLYLTGQKISPDREEWRKWWAKAAEEFVIEPLEGIVRKEKSDE